jgi:hypothetical protein
MPGAERLHSEGVGRVINAFLDGAKWSSCNAVVLEAYYVVSAHGSIEPLMEVAAVCPTALQRL